MKKLSILTSADPKLAEEEEKIVLKYEAEEQKKEEVGLPASGIDWA